MKNAVVLTLITFLTVSYFSCTKDKSSSCTQTDNVNTYTNSVKVILDAECASAGCHDAITARSGVKLDNYANSVASAKGNSKFFCTIDWTCTPTMPDGYSFPLDTSMIHAIERWRDNCYPE